MMRCQCGGIASRFKSGVRLFPCLWPPPGPPPRAPPALAVTPFSGFPTAAFTISAWVRISGSGRGKLHTVLGYGTEWTDSDATIAGVPLVTLSVNDSTGGLTMLVRQRSCGVNLGPSSAADGAWHHIAVSWSKLSETLR